MGVLGTNCTMQIDPTPISVSLQLAVVIDQKTLRIVSDVGVRIQFVTSVELTSAFCFRFNRNQSQKMISSAVRIVASRFPVRTAPRTALMGLRKQPQQVPVFAVRHFSAPPVRVIGLFPSVLLAGESRRMNGSRAHRIVSSAGIS